MIDLVEGEGLGAGKSYYLLHEIAAHVAKGGTVYMTDSFEVIWDRLYGPLEEEEAEKRQRHFGGYRFPCEGFVEYVEDEFGVTPERDQIRVIPCAETWRIHELTGAGTDACPVLIMIDEAHIGLNAKDTRDTEKRPLFDWATQSRHDSNDLIFCTQDVKNLDSQVKRLASKLVITTNLYRDAGFPIIGKIKAFIWRYKHPETGRQYDFKMRWYDRRVMLAYESKSQAGKHKRNGEVIKRKKLKKKKKVSNTMKMIGWLAIGGLLIGGYKTVTMFYRMSHPEHKTETANVVHTASTALASAVAPAQPVATPPPLFRVIEEEYQGGDGRSFLHTDKGVYEVGEMTANGLVQGVQGHVARCLDPFGKLAFVVGRQKGVATAAAFVPVSRATPAPMAGAGPALWSPAPQPFSDAEQARIREEIAKPVGMGNLSDSKRRR